MSNMFKCYTRVEGVGDRIGKVGGGGQPRVAARVFSFTTYLLEVYLVTALVPSETACLASSPGSSRRTAV